VILKYNKRFNSVLTAIVVLVVVVVVTFTSTNSQKINNFSIIFENFRESIFTYNPSVSRLSSWDDSESSTKKIINALNTISTVIYKNIIGFDRPDINELYIHIDFKDYQKILRDRAKAIEVGLLRNPTKVNAIVKYNGRKYKAKIRLKGDLKDHWLSQYRMSFRVKLKSGKTIFGLNEFSIQKPRSRMFPYDDSFQELLKSIGFLAAKHKYVKVKFNGNDWGVMDIESHVSKEFLETQNRKDSIVVRFSNEDGWFYHAVSKNPDYSYRISNPMLYTKVYNYNKKMKDEINRARFSYIIRQKFLFSEADLYDTESYLNLLLLTKIWGSNHVLYDNNIKHYFNPYTLKLEPIALDQVEPRINDFSYCPFNFRFVSSVIYNNLNKRDLSLFHVKEKLNRIRRIVEKNVGSSIKLKQNTFPLDPVASTALINKNMELMSGDNIEQYIRPYKCYEEELEDTLFDPLNYPSHVHAYHYSNGNIKIFNLLRDKVKVLYVRDLTGVRYYFNKEIPEYIVNSYTPINFKTNLIGNYDYKLFIVTSYKGQEREVPLEVTLTDKDVYSPLAFTTPDDLKFLYERNDKDWFLRKGVWEINEPLVIHGDLTIEEGTTLKFSELSYLIVKGRLSSIGSEGKGIILTSTGGYWGGIYVYDSPLESKLKNTIISKTASIKDGILNLSGGVTFYNTDVNIENVEFLNSMSEDMLNIVNSSFSLKNIVMSDARSDAIDFDYSDGSIDNIKIFDVGGDALDFSGSTSKISNANIFNIQDKAFSAGEESYLNIDKSRISHVGVGVASKDGSKVNVLNTSILNVTLSPAMTYIKKSFYGIPELTLQFCEMNPSDNIVAQTATRIIANGIHVETQYVNVEQLYMTPAMKK